MISISSFLSSSCFLSHSWRNSSRSFLSASSRSRSGKNEVSTAGFFPNLGFFIGFPSSSTSAPGAGEFEWVSFAEDSCSSPSSSKAKDRVDFCAFLRFLVFFCSSLNRSYSL